MFRSRFSDLLDDFERTFDVDPHFPPMLALPSQPEEHADGKKSKSSKRKAESDQQVVSKESAIAPFHLPRMDFVEQKDQYEAHLDLPGMKKGDVKVEVHDGSLKVSGERKQELQEEKDGYSRYERSYGSFSRVVRLPQEVDENQISAKHEDGVLKIQMKKKPVPEKHQPTKKIDIK